MHMVHDHAPLWDPIPSHYMHHPNQSAVRDSCLVEEGCLNGFGIRKVIAFSTQVYNIGCAPFVVGVPSGYEPGSALHMRHNTLRMCVCACALACACASA